MKLEFNVGFFIMIGYYIYKFIIFLVKMKGDILLPKREEEAAVIRRYPQRTVDLPIYSKHKVGIVIYAFMLVFVIVMFCLGAIFRDMNWSFYLILAIPLYHSHNLFNIFAIVDDGLISGSHFIPWSKIKSFQFVPINSNHKYFGYSKEANSGYELKIRSRFGSTSYIITSNEMKERLSRIFSEHVKGGVD